MVVYHKFTLTWRAGGGGDHYPLLHLLKLNDMQSDIRPAASVVSYSPTALREMDSKTFIIQEHSAIMT